MKGFSFCKSRIFEYSTLFAHLKSKKRNSKKIQKCPEARSAYSRLIHTEPSLPRIKLKLSTQRPPDKTDETLKVEPVVEETFSEQDLDSSDNDASVATSASTAPKQRGKRKGQGGKTFSRKKPKLNEMIPPRDPKPMRKRGMKSALSKLLHALKQYVIALGLIRFRRDTYGFFLEPVDQTVIKDYSAIVKNPMDLGTFSFSLLHSGTMEIKLENDQYSHYHEFKVRLYFLKYWILKLSLAGL